jgi:hypothetical protein
MIDRTKQFCFQFSGFTGFRMGQVTNQWLDESGWAMAEVQWSSGGTSEEKLANLSFDLDRFRSLLHLAWVVNIESEGYDNTSTNACGICQCSPCDCADLEAPSGINKY